MKKMNIKKVIGLIACILVTTSTGLALASSLEITNQDDLVSQMGTLKLMTGSNNMFNKEGNLTRAEASTILMRMLGYDKLPKSSTVFSDVPISHWASGYIRKSHELEIVKGGDNGKFRPSDNVTIEQLITMLVRAIGAKEEVEANTELKWPNNYLEFAKEHNIFEESVEDGILAKNNATRIETAHIVSKVLLINSWKENKETDELVLKTLYNYDYLKDVKVLSVNIEGSKILLDTGDYGLSLFVAPEIIDLASIKEGEVVNVWINPEKKTIAHIDSYNSYCTIYKDSTYESKVESDTNTEVENNTDIETNKEASN